MTRIMMNLGACEFNNSSLLWGTGDELSGTAFHHVCVTKLVENKVVTLGALLRCEFKCVGLESYVEVSTLRSFLGMWNIKSVVNYGGLLGLL